MCPCKIGGNGNIYRHHTPDCPRRTPAEPQAGAQPAAQPAPTCHICGWNLPQHAKACSAAQPASAPAQATCGGRSINLYAYDRELRPGTIGADFESGDPNESFTKRYDLDQVDEIVKMLQDIAEWVEGKPYPLPSGDIPHTLSRSSKLH